MRLGTDQRLEALGKVTGHSGVSAVVLAERLLPQADFWHAPPEPKPALLRFADMHGGRDQRGLGGGLLTGQARQVQNPHAAVFFHGYDRVCGAEINGETCYDGYSLEAV